MHQNLAKLDWNWSFLECGHSFRENWIFWFISSRNFSLKIKSMWVTYKFWKDPISRRVHHRWFWGIRISYLRYVNYLQPGYHRNKYQSLAVKNVQKWSLNFDLIQSSRVWTYQLLHAYGHLLVQSHHSNVRKTFLWLFTTLLHWFPTNKYLLGKWYLLFNSSHQAGTHSPQDSL